MVGCGTPGTPRASAGSLVCRVRVQETLGLVPAHWWVKPGSGASASSLAGRAGFWSLDAGPRGPRAGLGLQLGGAVPDTTDCNVWGVQSLYWPYSGQGQGPASPRAGASLLVGGLSLQAVDIP